MEPGTIGPSWPGMIGSLAKDEALQLEGLSRVEAGRLGFSPTQPSRWARVEQTGCQEIWGADSSQLRLAGPMGLGVQARIFGGVVQLQGGRGMPSLPSSASSARAPEKFISSKWILMMNQVKSWSVESSWIPSHGAGAVK